MPATSANVGKKSVKSISVLDTWPFGTLAVHMATRGIRIPHKVVAFLAPFIDFPLNIECIKTLVALSVVTITSVFPRILFT